MHSYLLATVTIIVDHTRELHGNQDDRTLEMETGAMGHREDVKEMWKKMHFTAMLLFAMSLVAKKRIDQQLLKSIPMTMLK